jgi:hypothetical protein
VIGVRAGRARIFYGAWQSKMRVCSPCWNCISREAKVQSMYVAEVSQPWCAEDDVDVVVDVHLEASI